MSSKRSATEASHNDEASHKTKKMHQSVKDDTTTPSPSRMSVYAWGCHCPWTTANGNENGSLTDGIVCIESLPEGVAGFATALDEEELTILSVYALFTNGTVQKVWNDTDYQDPHPLNTHIAEKSQIFKSISSGLGHFSGIRMDGKLVTWGKNTHGQLGRNLQGPEFGAPQVVQFPLRPSLVVTQVACGLNHTLALASTGSVFSWGDNKCTGLGKRDGHQAVPAKVGDFYETYTHVATQYLHSAAVSKGGTVYSWGCCGEYDNLKQVLGHNGNGIVPSRVQDQYVLRCLLKVKVTMLACGYNHSIVGYSDGAVYSWGGNESGQLGLGHFDEVQGCKNIMSLQDFRLSKIVCGHSSTFAVTTGGDLYSWGANHGHFAVPGDEALPKKMEETAPFFVSDIFSHGDLQVTVVCPRINDFVPAPAQDSCPQFEDQDSFQDVAFAVENKVFYAHRYVLSRRCGFFQTMFASGMKESLEQEVVQIKDVQHGTFLNLLGYLYTDKITITSENVLEIFRLSDMYDLPKLGDHCCWMTKQLLTVENVVPLVCQADAFGFVRIRNICVDFIKDNCGAVSERDEFRSTISRDLLLDIFVGQNLSSP